MRHLASLSIAALIMVMMLSLVPPAQAQTPEPQFYVGDAQLDVSHHKCSGGSCPFIEIWEHNLTVENSDRVAGVLYNRSVVGGEGWAGGLERTELATPRVRFDTGGGTYTPGYTCLIGGDDYFGTGFEFGGTLCTTHLGTSFDIVQSHNITCGAFAPCFWESGHEGEEIIFSIEAKGGIDGVGVDVDVWDVRLIYFGSPDVEAAFEAVPTEGPAPLTVDFFNQSQNAVSYEWDFGDGNTSTAFNPYYTYEVAGTYTVTLTAYGVGDTFDTATEVITVESPFDMFEAVEYKPLKVNDRDDDFDYYDQIAADLLPQPLAYTHVPLDADIYSVFAWANDDSADVHAVGPGTVKEIEAPGEDNCTSDLNGVGLLLSECLIKVPVAVVMASGQTPVEHVYRLATDQLYRVRVEYDEGFYIDYFVSEPKVEQFDEITSGCIIGKTVPIYHLSASQIESVSTNLSIELDFTSEPIDKSVTILAPTMSLELQAESGLTGRIYPYMVLNPTSLTPCNADPRFATCVGDAELASSANWEQFNVVWNPGQKPLLHPTGYIAEELILPAETAHSLTVQIVNLDGGPGQVQLQIGTTTQIFEITTRTGSYQIPADIHQADKGLVYTIKVQNTGTTALQVLSVCPSQTEPDTSAPTCVFQNASFDSNLDFWSYSSDVTGGLLSGEIFMGDGSTLSQEIQLYPNGAMEWEYAITIRATVIGEGWETETASEVGFSWEYDGNSDDFISPSSTTSYDFAAFRVVTPNYITTFPGNEVVFQAIVPIASATTDIFTVTSHIDLEGDFDGKVKVREVCVNNPWGEPGNGGGGGGGIPFPTNCNFVSPPTDENLSSWIYYLWTSIDRFNRCDLMPLLTEFHNTVWSGFYFLRWQTLYWQSVMLMFTNWLGSLIPWLNGHFRNMAVGQVTTINDTTGAGFWDVLIALINTLLAPFLGFIIGILTQAANLLFGLITNLLSIAVALLTMAFNLLGQFGYFLASLAGAWNNATPTVPDGLPQCSLDYTSSPFCLAAWVLENTVLSGPGIVIIPLIIGFGSVMLLLWAVTSIRNLIVSTGRNI